MGGRLINRRQWLYTAGMMAGAAQLAGATKGTEAAAQGDSSSSAKPGPLPVSKYDKGYPGRFYTFTEPSYERFKEPNYPQIQADAIARAHHDGARGLKILKTLGLYLRENIISGTLVKIDDHRFDPMWDACGQ